MGNSESMVSNEVPGHDNFVKTSLSTRSRISQMRKRILRLFLLSTAVSLLVACHRPQGDDIGKRIDEIVRFRVENKEFTGSVLVAKGDEILLNKGYGLANREWNIPNTPTTKYRLGSVTKQFTTAAILLLEEQGKLKVEDL